MIILLWLYPYSCPQHLSSALPCTALPPFTILSADQAAHRVLMQLWSKEAPSELVVSPIIPSLLHFSCLLSSIFSCPFQASSFVCVASIEAYKRYLLMI
jgi:hypothetical protein